MHDINSQWNFMVVWNVTLSAEIACVEQLYTPNKMERPVLRLSNYQSSDWKCEKACIKKKETM